MGAVNEPPGSGPAVRQTGRCHECGHSLSGLAVSGACPECGAGYDDRTAALLEPWPSAPNVLLRLGWPILGLMIVVSLQSSAGSDETGIALFVLGAVALLAVPVNSYFQVRRMLARSLPNRTRTTGMVAVLRAIGTTICFLLAIAIIVPTVLLGACMILLINW